MNYIIVGLGNPGQEYENTRHNTGRIIVDSFGKKFGVVDWKEDKKTNSEVAKVKIGKNTAILIKPNTFMNKSGDALRSLIKNKKTAETLLVVHDDLDIPFGKIKMSFNKSSGGHRGVESIIKAIKTEGFIRLRIGISNSTASGKIKKPLGEEAVEKAILGKFKPNEILEIKKIIKKTNQGLEILLTEDRNIATGFLNK